MNANATAILTQVNTLMTRRGIALHKITRAVMSGKYDNAEVAQLRTFVRAATTRAAFLMSQIS